MHTKSVTWAAIALTSLIPVLCLASITNSLSIELVKAPTGHNLPMYAQIVGGDDSDPTPNPCYGNTKCYIAAWAVSGTWPNKYMRTYPTNDVRDEITRKACGQTGKTIGDVVHCLRELNLLYITLTDYLPSNYGPDDEMCLFINEGANMNLGASLGPLGSCVKTYVPAKCYYTGTLDINVKGSASSINEGSSAPATGGGSINCDNDTSGTLRLTNTSGSITLDNGGQCAVDFGAGPGAGLPLTVSGGRPYQISASCHFSGVEHPGVHRGSAVVLFSLD